MKRALLVVIVIAWGFLFSSVKADPLSQNYRNGVFPDGRDVYGNPVMGITPTLPIYVQKLNGKDKFGNPIGGITPPPGYISNTNGYSNSTDTNLLIQQQVQGMVNQQKMQRYIQDPYREERERNAVAQEFRNYAERYQNRLKKMDEDLEKLNAGSSSSSSSYGSDSGIRMGNAFTNSQKQHNKIMMDSKIHNR